MDSERIQAGIHDVCHDLKIEPPTLYEPGTVIDPGPKTRASIEENICRMANQGTPYKYLGQMHDAFRATILSENFSDVLGNMQKLTTSYPGFGGYFKERNSSGYCGVHMHGHGNYAGAKSEIMIGTPEWYAVKTIADMMYRDTRVYASMKEELVELQKNGKVFTPAQRNLFRELEEDFKVKSGYEKRLFSLIHKFTDLPQQQDNIREFFEKLTALNGAQAQEAIAISKLTPALEMRLTDRDGKTDARATEIAIDLFVERMEDTQKKVCIMAVSTLANGKIVTVNPLEAIKHKENVIVPKDRKIECVLNGGVGADFFGK